ncbi:splicing regulator RBM11 [Bombus huntii]|uniref:splicing regulator RBM11 n=1 Tax=Bombus huntii TaxID=85661 RepID=UPI0021AA5960|nr:splicing regulator RBM11 [Bombus huntii]
MSEDMKTLWCGNLSDKVTEEILYELFLQAGPVQNVTIPKDRNGKQRPFGFVTYKHVNSVLYALELFNGTSLFNRILNISHRKNVELPQINYSQDNFINFNNWLQLGQEMILGNDMSHLKEDSFGTNMILNTDLQMKETNNCSHKNDRRSQRTHPYHRDQHKHSNHHMDHSSTRNRNSHNSNHYSKHSYKNSRRTY